MRINYIASYTKSFRGNAQNQGVPYTPSTPQSMTPIFINPDIPNDLKRTLWTLSEIPYFCEVAEHCSPGNLLRLSKMVKRAKTNVIMLALQDAIEVEKQRKRRRLLSLKKIAEESKEKNPSVHVDLLGTIKALPLSKIETDVERSYKSENDYPTSLEYKSQTPQISIHKLENSAFTDNIRRTIENGTVPADKSDVSIIFKKQLKYKGEVNPQYYPTPTEIIEEPLSKTPANIKEAYQLKIATPEENKCLLKLEEIPYFSNLAQFTEPIRLNSLAEWDENYDGIFRKMFSKEATLEVYNPRTQKTIKFPIIDLERLLADQKFGIYEEKDLLNILQQQTMAMEIYRCCKELKDECHGDVITSLILKMDGDNVGIACYTQGDDSTSAWTGSFNEGNPDQVKIRNFLEKMPTKTATINFIKEELPIDYDV